MLKPLCQRRYATLSVVVIEDLIGDSENSVQERQGGQRVRLLFSYYASEKNINWVSWSNENYFKQKTIEQIIDHGTF